MDEVSSHVCLVLPSTDRKAARKIVPPRLRIPYWKGLGADSEEKHEPVSDIDTVVVDSLKALDPKRPIREADMTLRTRYVRFVRTGDTRPSDVIRTTEQFIGIARANVRRQEEALRIAKAKFTGGGTSELDVFQATNVLEQ